MKPTDKDIESVKAANPGVDIRLSREETLDVEVIFKVPPPGDWKRFRDLGGNPETKSLASKSLVFSCRLWPAKEEFEDLIESFPGLVETFAGELVKIAGVSEAVSTKKL